ncbi:MAG: histidinol-phosphate transaminase [Desulfovibrionaceae bacterium]|jgi:histidinol-phosphate aminotransferase|nr:histidinol-phosphate transaminase [Desulfovibrionaceae bacterium]
MSIDTARPALSPACLKPEVRDFSPYVAGMSIDEIRERYGLAQVVKMASNENPLGTSPLVQRAICEHAGLAFRYAQSGNPRLVRAIAEHLGVESARVVVGNGSDEIIDLLIRVLARPGVDNVIAFKPSFSMYGLQSRLCGVEFRATPLNADFTFPWDAFVAQADAHTALAFVTTPDNPSGFTPPAAELEALAARLPQGCLLVVDEAYMDFVADQAAHSLLGRLASFPNVAVLRTFSKLYGLAGLRLGYGVLPEWLADYMWRTRPPFSVNVLAEAAGLAALEDQVFRDETVRAVAEGRQYLAHALRNLGCEVLPSQSNFLMFRPVAALDGGVPVSARVLFERLLERGVIIRPLKSYGLEEWVRVSVGNERENALFIELTREILHG